MLEGICDNNKCRAYTKKVIKHIGFGIFDYYKDK